MINLKNIISNIVLWAKKDKKIIMASVLGGLLITTVVGVTTKTYSETIQQGIADSVVRFHVLANSDSNEDQSLKLKVKDEVLLAMKGKLDSSKDINETKSILEDSKEEIKQTALNVIKDEGYNYDVNVILSRELFPIKKYGDVVFPSGMYDAVRIEIGSGEGHNWWCVMFPPLCFVDVTCDEVSPECKNQLKNVLTEEEYSVVLASKSKEDIVPEVKLKIVEWWQGKENKGRKYATKP